MIFATLEVGDLTSLRQFLWEEDFEQFGKQSLMFPHQGLYRLPAATGRPRKEDGEMDEGLVSHMRSLILSLKPNRGTATCNCIHQNWPATTNLGSASVHRAALWRAMYKTRELSPSPSTPPPSPLKRHPEAFRSANNEFSAGTYPGKHTHIFVGLWKNAFGMNKMYNVLLFAGPNVNRSHVIHLIYSLPESHNPILKWK